MNKRNKLIDQVGKFIEKEPACFFGYAFVGAITLFWAGIFMTACSQKKEAQMVIPTAIARATTEATLIAKINDWVMTAARNGKTHDWEYVYQYTPDQRRFIIASLLDKGYAVRVGEEDNHIVKIYFAWDDLDRFNRLTGDEFNKAYE